MFYNLINDCLIDPINWSDFEDSLKNIQWDYLLNEDLYYYDKENDLDIAKTSNNFSDLAYSIYLSCHILNDLFTNWIINIDNKINCVKK